ncbi:BA75_04593T0 [Komagataella pastoris]|uniref:BA75_04593T0 n=1 Tax=Komagataella pastoris TaxID=4922 RepID=A0A1B2JIF7_PICPA|nr:BA75_04593T0 [Komagataella pastoris]
MMAANIKPHVRPNSVRKRLNESLETNEREKRFCSRKLHDYDDHDSMDMHANYTTSPIERKRSLSPNAPTSPVTEDDSDAKPLEHNKQNIHELADNPDYIALCSTLSLLKQQRGLVTQDIQRLQETKMEAMQDPSSFLRRLATRQVTLPGLTKVIVSPSIHWSKYGYSEDFIFKKPTKKDDRHIVFKESKFFD